MKTAVLLGLSCVALRVFAAEVPRSAPDLAILLPDGKQVKLSDYRGKVVAFAVILTT